MFNPDGSISSLFTVDETDTVASDGKTYKGMFDFKLWRPATMPSAWDANRRGQGNHGRYSHYRRLTNSNPE